MKRELKITVLHTETLKRWGGQQNRVLAESVGLAHRGHRVIIACNRGSVLAQKASASGIKVYEMDFSKKTYYRTIPQLIRIIREERIEIVSTHSSVDSWAGGIAARLTGRKLVRFRHNLFPVGRDPLTRLIYSIPDRIIAISNAVKAVLEERGVGGPRVRVIHSAVDPERFKPGAPDLRDELGIPSDVLVIGNTSTFTRVKGQEYLLHAFNTICREHDAYLLLAGKLVEEKKWKYLRHVDERFREKVILAGHREDIPCLLNTLDIFVFPSLLEGLGTALIEAMMMGRPVAVSDIATFRDFIDDGENGIFFRHGDPRDIASKVMSLIEQKDLMNRIGRSARNTAMKLFSTAAMVDKTEKLYAELTGRGSHSA